MGDNREQLEQRLVDLETRVAFQEQALSELSDALAAARDDEARNALAMHRILEELKHMRSAVAANPFTADPSQEPPPPHY
jgi:SlyX protein